MLVNRGYLEVEQDKLDRRLLHLRITEKAKEAADILHAAQFSFYDKVTAGLSNEEVSAMLSAIEKCAGNLKE
ncbi:MAG: MarR family winged helix-turn-helix transcriptional regulator [Clostridiales bacterium]|nr:MarR family winged helix-turn-helix transcriptional regulator [Clostridiales bacterium]